MARPVPRQKHKCSQQKSRFLLAGDGAGLRATSAAPINYWVAAEAALAMVARRAWAKRVPAGGFCSK